MTSHASAPGDRTVPWLDVFPKTCRVKPVKYVCSINARSLPETTDPDTEFRYVDISNVDSDGNWIASEPMRFGDSPSRARRVVADGDVLVSTVRTYLRAIAHIDRVDDPLICSTGFAVLSANGAVASKFLAYWARSVHFIDEVVARSVGVSYPAVNAPDLGNIPCPVLPLDEQRAIAAFLDRETTRIDALIEKKHRQIELLHEKRAALISHAVTKGLDPTAPMKDSGTEWLGEMPATWTLKRLRHISPRLGVGLVINPSTYVDPDGAVPFLFGSDIRPFRLLPEQARRISQDSNRQLAESRLQAGDVVTVRVGAPGVSACVPAELDGANCASVMITRRAPTFDSRWLCYVFNSSWGQFQVGRVAYGAAQRQFNIGHAVDFLFPVPPLHEQIEISDALNEARRCHDALATKITFSIDRLREYRTALISAAVTGKIDVRQEVA